MKTFIRIWLAQFLSMFGSNLTGFALGLHILEKTGSVTSYTLVAFATVTPMIVFSPLLGTLVDRWPRKRSLLVGQCVAATATAGLAAMFFSGNLGIAAIVALLAVSGIANALYHNAMSATTALLVPPEDLGRAAGFDPLGTAASQICTPFIAAMLLQHIGLGGVFLVDLATFSVPIMVLLATRIPAPPASEARRWLDDISFGFQYFRRDGGLWRLLLLIFAANAVLGIAQILFTPLILAFTDKTTLGIILSVAGLGLMLGGLAMIAISGVHRRLPIIEGAGIFMGIMLACTALRPSPWWVGGGTFLALAAVPAIFGGAQAILQKRIPVEIQGRVLGFYAMGMTSAMPIAYLIAGPLVDRVFVPAMHSGGWLNFVLGSILGERGVAAVFLMLGGILALVSVLAIFSAPLRAVEAKTQP